MANTADRMKHNLSFYGGRRHGPAWTYPHDSLITNPSDRLFLWSTQIDRVYGHRKKAKYYTRRLIEYIFTTGGWEFSNPVAPVVELSAGTLTYDENDDEDLVPYLIYPLVIKERLSYLTGDPADLMVLNAGYDKVYTVRKPAKIYRKPVVANFLKGLRYDLV